MQAPLGPRGAADDRRTAAVAFRRGNGPIREIVPVRKLRGRRRAVIRVQGKLGFASLIANKEPIARRGRCERRHPRLAFEPAEREKGEGESYKSDEEQDRYRERRMPPYARQRPSVSLPLLLSTMAAIESGRIQKEPGGMVHTQFGQPWKPASAQ